MRQHDKHGVNGHSNAAYHDFSVEVSVRTQIPGRILQHHQAMCIKLQWCNLQNGANREQQTGDVASLSSSAPSGVADPQSDATDSAVDTAKLQFAQDLSVMLPGVQDYIMSDNISGPFTNGKSLLNICEGMIAMTQQHTVKNDRDWQLFHIICQEMQASMAGRRALPNLLFPSAQTWRSCAETHHGITSGLLLEQEFDKAANKRPLLQSKLLQHHLMFNPQVHPHLHLAHDIANCLHHHVVLF